MSIWYATKKVLLLCSRESAARGAEIRARIERIKSGESDDGADA